MKRFLTLFLSLLLFSAAFAQNAPAVDSTYYKEKPTKSKPDTSFVFASYESGDLSLDVYFPAESDSLRYCVVHAYGGGFLFNTQKSSYVKDYCRKLADNGYVAIAIDYRLGLQGVKMKGVLSMVKPLMNSIHIASEDMLKATSFVLQNADEWKIRKDGIIASGSSAGAITALQTDYELSNRAESSKVLPEGFRYAGVVSLAGAVLSNEGRCKYKVQEPAPTLMLHGTKDKLVEYNNIAFCNLRFSGSSDLVKSFVKGKYAYELIRYEGEGHGVANRALDSFQEIMWFLDNMVKKHEFYQIDKTIWDRDHVRPKWDQLKPQELY